MKKWYLLALIVSMLSTKVFSQGGTGYTYIPAVKVYYDANGNRIIRQMETICIGCDHVDPPPYRLTDTTKKGGNLAGIDSAELNIEVYPNPVEEKLTIENLTWKSGSKASFRLFDLSGKLVRIKDIDQAKEVIDLYNAMPGAYQLEYYLNGNLIKIWKIIKH